MSTSHFAFLLFVFSSLYFRHWLYFGGCSFQIESRASAKVRGGQVNALRGQGKRINDECPRILGDININWLKESEREDQRGKKISGTGVSDASCNKGISSDTGTKNNTSCSLELLVTYYATKCVCP